MTRAAKSFLKLYVTCNSYIAISSKPSSVFVTSTPPNFYASTSVYFDLPEFYFHFPEFVADTITVNDINPPRRRARDACNEKSLTVTISNRKVRQ